ncbi:hypothetical protein ODZ84_10130 [Chryseobacterium fluminis]|uniref:hypothetical protein n=1 Tax=Chryseobacterium fluminis TaxID=2983606 RepID=UPI00225BFC4C|nr:hypothetical protein [Chryseobacterium sp. MMS21-Ot14]UZT99889.1 hypothetical protein ODZ84_10130 [Chryseobacterium sp. MMS21-Ot14]
MKVFLSSIAKNDIRLLLRVFNAEKEHKGSYFLEDLKESIDFILEESERIGKSSEITIRKMENFPVHIHYLFENNETLFIAAIFKELN